MSVRNAIALFVCLGSITFLAACGSSGNGVTQGQAPPSGQFSDSNLNGTYVFSVSGLDANGFSYAITGTLNANSNGGITGGVIDMNDAEFAPNSVSPLIASGINSTSSYSVGKDGRGKATLNLSSNPLGSLCGTNNISFDFVLQDSFHGQVTESDCNATGSGTLDVQTAGVTPAGSYAFSMSGGVSSSSGVVPFATVGNLTLSGSTITAGLEDFNVNGVPYTNTNSGYAVSGSVVAGGSASSISSITTGSSFGNAGTLSIDVYPIDSTHLKLIEVDGYGTLSGDAYAETTTFPSGTLVFTLAGTVSGEPFAAGGIMVTSGGTIGSGSTEDFNELGTTSTIGTPVPFTGSYSGANGRFPVSLSSFEGGTDYVAYPSSGGTLLMETDTSSLNIQVGAAYAQTTTTSFTSSQGYGLNLTGVNLSASSQAGAAIEVDDIAEFTAAASGSSCTASSGTVSTDTLIGVTDENNQPDQATSYGLALCGQYASVDSAGRVEAAYGANTLNGGIEAISYTVDGTFFPFIEVDGGQVSTGAFILQNPSATSQTLTVRPSSLFIPRPFISRRAATEKKKLQN
ncbi:MAG TPA: hypothetical protein VND65_02550 [Candidatus Binatia bacterium]|nr:hypothetical protein [Candidatus Binatia bacterium]